MSPILMLIRGLPISHKVWKTHPPIHQPNTWENYQKVMFFLEATHPCDFSRPWGKLEFAHLCVKWIVGHINLKGIIMSQMDNRSHPSINYNQSIRLKGFDYCDSEKVKLTDWIMSTQGWLGSQYDIWGYKKMKNMKVKYEEMGTHEKLQSVKKTLHLLM